MAIHPTGCHCDGCQGYDTPTGSPDKPAADPAQSAPSAEPRKVTGGLGGKFYLSPDGNWIIWDQQPSEYADAAHRGLFHALKEAKTRAETAESALRQSENQQETLLKECVREIGETNRLLWDVGFNLSDEHGHKVALADRINERRKVLGLLAFHKIDKARALLTVAAQTPQQVKNPGRSMGDAK